MTTLPPTIGVPVAEAAALGCLLRMPLQEGRALLALLHDDDLVDPRHNAVLLAARALLDSGSPADPVLVLGQLRRSGLEKAHTADKDAGVFLVELAASAPALSSASYYARIVVEHAYRRRVQSAATRLLRAAGQSDLDELNTLVLAEASAIAAQRRRTHPAAEREAVQ